jgi:predicted component of type VI protein secretion system
MILAKINGSIAGKTNFVDLSMGWLKGIKVSDFSFNDNAGQISVQVKEIATKPHYGSLLTGNLSFGQTLIDTPNVEINLKAQKPGIPSQKVPAKTATKSIALPVKRMELVLNDGNFKVTDPKSGTVELSRINSKLNLQPPGQQTDFDLTMAVAQAGKPAKIQVAGGITPGKQTGWSLKGTSGDLTIDVNGLDLESLGPIFALAGADVEAKGLLEGQIKSQIKDGKFENMTADLKGSNLDITAGQLKGDRLRTSTLEAGVKLNQAAETINIDNLQLKSDWASVTAGGAVPTTFKSLADFLAPGSNYSLKGTFNCNVAALSSQIPKTLGVKEGMKITSGQLNGSIETSTQSGRKQLIANATLAGLEGEVEGKKTALSGPIRADAQISPDKTGVSFDKLDVSAPFAKINCAGTSESIKYSAEANLAKLQSELGQFIDIGQYKMSGEIASKGQVSITEQKIATSASSTIKNLVLNSADGKSISEPMAEIASSVEIDSKNSLVNIGSVKAVTSFGKVSVENGVVPMSKDAAKPMHVAVSASDVNLNKLQPLLVMFASFPKDMQLFGIAEAPILVNSEKGTYKITTDSTKVKGLKLTSPGKKPFEPNDVTLAFDAEVNPEQKAISAKAIRLTSPQINLKFTNGRFSQLTKDGKTTLQGQAECEYDWAALSPVTARFLPEDLTLQGKRKDTVSFTSEYPADQTDKLLSNLNAKTNVGFEKASYMGLDFGPTDVDIQVQNGLLNIAPFATTVNEGQFNFAGGADFKQTPALFKDIKINDATTKRLLKYVNPIFADAVNVSGIANFNSEQMAIPLSSEAKNDTVVIGTISMNQVRLQASDLLGQILTLAGGNVRGTVLTVHPTKLVLQKGILRYDDMQIDVGDNPINFKGAIGLDKSLDMTVTLPYTTAGRTARVDRETRGARITLPLKGTLDKPELDTGKLLELQLKEQGEELLRRGLEDIFK